MRIRKFEFVAKTQFFSQKRHKVIVGEFLNHSNPAPAAPAAHTYSKNYKYPNLQMR